MTNMLKVTLKLIEITNAAVVLELIRLTFENGCYFLEFQSATESPSEKPNLSNSNRS